MALVAGQKQKSEAIVRMQKAEEESAGVKGGSPMVVGFGFYHTLLIKIVQLNTNI
jgi:hypothetical protein